jgi:hypothetical protein
MFELRHFQAWQIALCLFVVLLLCVELGFWAGRRFKKPHEDSKSALTAVKGAVLALVGLLLGFSFSISMTRFEGRRQLMLDEANAIDTAYLRGDLMEEPAKSQYKELLRNYIDARIDSFKAAAVLNTQEWLHIRTATDLQNKIWGLAADFAKRNPEAGGAILIPSAVNHMIDIGRKREAARLVEVPPPILWLLIVAVMIASLLVGHSFGIAWDRNWPMTMVFCFLLIMVAYIIMDLDTPSRGLIQGNQREMEYQRSTMK